MKDKLFLPILESSENVYAVPLETVISVFVLNYCQDENINVEIVLVNEKTIEQPLFPVLRSAFELKSIVLLQREKLPKQIQDCTLPALECASAVTYVGGLCSVLRWTIKSVLAKDSNHHASSILGFRGGCLSACSEVSLWTRFCETDLPLAVKKLLNLILKECSDQNGLVLLPEELMKLEQHLSLPVRTHNILKRKQDIVKISKENIPHDGTQNNTTADVEYLSNCVEEINIGGIRKNCTDMQLEHIFAEGIDKTLADLILLPCVHIILTSLEHLGSDVLQHIPYVYNWYKRLMCDQYCQKSSEMCGWKKYTPSNVSNWKVQIPTVARESLYTRDPKRRKIRIRHHDPSPIIERLKVAGIKPNYLPHPCEDDGMIDWHCLPMSAHPAGGDLPLSRVDRKCQQVESIVMAVIKMAKNEDIIVDFCSGGGHIGVLLAFYLPKCKIVMIENKEASLERARRRTEDLQLDNVTFYQCNLDYYKGSFNIAVALHACGVSTDLVIQKSLEQGASFVCCPCCYGYICDIRDITYPRSKAFRQAGVTYQDFLKLCHCADRTEVGTKAENEGKLCMALVDTDRCLYAQENGYNSYLCTLMPPDCTPKSNLLIAIKE